MIGLQHLYSAISLMAFHQCIKLHLITSILLEICFRQAYNSKIRKANDSVITCYSVIVTFPALCTFSVGPRTDKAATICSIFVGIKMGGINAIKRRLSKKSKEK